MQIKEIIEQDSNNVGSIILFRGGVFWIAFERSAFFSLLHIENLTSQPRGSSRVLAARLLFVIFLTLLWMIYL
jgi:hypothetical protein